MQECDAPVSLRREMGWPCRARVVEIGVDFAAPNTLSRSEVCG